MANVDEKVYATTPDNKISLTEKGLSQANETGITLKKLLKNEKILFYVSPYQRTK